MINLDMFNAAFFISLFSIIMIDIVLAGDNSIVIAMAVQSLPQNQRFKGILLGAMAAVGLRVIFTFFAAKLLLIPFVKLVGGILIIWIAIKLMTGMESEHKNSAPAKTLWNAVGVILVADLTMSIDNILAVAGASHGNFFLLLFGLGLSIPLVVGASTLIAKLMDKFPLIVWAGAIILGKVGGEMCVTDPVIVSRILTPLNLIEMRHGTMTANHTLVLITEISLAAMIVIVSLLIKKGQKKKNTTS